MYILTDNMRIRLTENRLREIIDECIKSCLYESYRADLYHFTNLEGIYGILSNNSIAIVETGDDIYDKNNEAVCLSRNGSPYMGYCPDTQYGLIFRITLDTEKMMSSIRGLKIRPWSMNNPRTELWGGKYHSVSDYEERAYVCINPLNKYCKSIDIYPLMRGDEYDEEQINIIDNFINDFSQWKSLIHIN